MKEIIEFRPTYESDKASEMDEKSGRSGRSKKINQRDALRKKFRVRQPSAEEESSSQNGSQEKVKIIDESSNAVSDGGKNSSTIRSMKKKL